VAVNKITVSTWDELGAELRRSFHTPTLSVVREGEDLLEISLPLINTENGPRAGFLPQETTRRLGLTGALQIFFSFVQHTPEIITGDLQALKRSTL